MGRNEPQYSSEIGEWCVRLQSDECVCRKKDVGEKKKTAEEITSSLRMKGQEGTEGKWMGMWWNPISAARGSRGTGILQQGPFVKARSTREQGTCEL